MKFKDDKKVRVIKVNKYFNRHRRNQIHVIDNTSFELDNSGMVVILGQSGSGKTTLLNAIGGLDNINKGQIYINNKKITRKTSRKVDKIRNINIGYIFQDYKLLENMSVYDNVALSLKMTGLKDKKEIEKRVNYVLNSVNMYRYRARPAKMLSGGEKQRVAIARAIVKNPNIVIADEPTGNLDSKNSLEIMNILKAISKNKLVILVTHEEDLAKFYASRILEIQDGKVIKDYKNKPKESLEYRLDNKIYLKDLKNINNFETDNLNINVFYDENENKNQNINKYKNEYINDYENESINECKYINECETTNKKESNTFNKINVKLVIKNGNIYINSNNNNIEIVDDNSAIEFVNKHYKKLDKESIKDDFNIEKVIDKKYKIKYKSIYGIFKSIKVGFKRLSNYSVLKKILLLGFFASSMFIVYSVCNIKGVQIVREKDFIDDKDRNYLQVEAVKPTVDEINTYQAIPNVDYVIPGDGKVSFKLKLDDYYQLAKQTYELSGSLASLDDIKQENLILGRIPQNEYEIVIDNFTIDKLLNTDNGFDIRGMGIKSNDQLLNKKVTIDNMKEFTIVGISDLVTPSIFVNKNLWVNILNNSEQSTFGTGMYFEDVSTENPETTKVIDYNLCLDDLTITKGRWPENDYEVIVNEINKDTMKLNKQINIKVNGTNLTVVGYYQSKSNKQDYYVNKNTVKYDVITKKTGFVIHTKDKASVYTELRDKYNLNVIDCYQESKEAYMKKREDIIKNSTISASIIMAISLIEIYLMIRSSFLSRIKEVGILRAIGVKKTDIYRMFLGEIIAITICGSFPGIALMSYILNGISKIRYLDNTFIVNSETIITSVIIICAINIVVGLLPLVNVLRKTPAQILARHDI